MTATNIDDSAVQNYDTIVAQAQSAMADLRAYINLSSPTNAQTVVVIKLLCKIQVNEIRLLLGMLDGTG